MSICNHNIDDELASLIISLPDGQAGTGRHKCAICAYEKGKIKTDIKNKELEWCKHNNYAPLSVLERLPDAQGGAGRHKCVICAYAVGLQQYKQVEIVEDIREINTFKVTETEKTILVNSRLGQGIFRFNLIGVEKMCRVTKLNDHKLLIASHIKPWRSSNNTERLDKYNGLLLSPHIDKLFDLGHISFLKDGTILSSEIAKNAFSYWSIKADQNVGEFNQQQIGYLEWHNHNVFCG